MLTLHSLVLLAILEGAEPETITAPGIVDRMVRAGGERLAALSGYTGTRRYRFGNKRFNKRAERTARVTCDGAGALAVPGLGVV